MMKLVWHKLFVAVAIIVAGVIILMNRNTVAVIMFNLERLE